jgi:lipopolysaccharide transport system permease protein
VPNPITKVYFPIADRFDVYVQRAGGFALAFTIHRDDAFLRHQPTAMITVAVLLPLALLSALGVGLWLSALNVEYRDGHGIIPFIVNWQVTPAHSSSLLSEPWRTLWWS